MYIVHFGGHFDAAHFLRSYNGKCANIHGHRWIVEGKVRGEKLNDIGLVVDFHDLKAWLKEICDAFDHGIINEMEGFREGERNPSAENIAQYIYKEMAYKLKQYSPELKLDCITVWESPNCGISYSE